MSTLINHSSLDKSERYNINRAIQLDRGFPWYGAYFQSDERSRNLIMNRALSLLIRERAGLSIPSIEWRDEDDALHTFTLDEFLNFASALDAHCEGIFKASWKGKAGANG